MIVKHMPANGAGYNHKITWRPIEMIDLRHFKESVISYVMHSPYVKDKVTKLSKIELFPRIGRDWCYTGGWSAVTMVNMVEEGSLEY